MIAKVSTALPYSIRVNRADAGIETAQRGAITISDVAGYGSALRWQLFVHNLPHYAMVIDIAA